MEKYLGIGLAIFLSGMLAPIIWSIIKKRQIKKESKMNKNDFVIYHSVGWVLGLIITSAVITTILCLLNFLNGFDTRTQFLVTNIIVIPFVLLFLLGAIGMAREKIIVKNDEIYITPFWGKRKQLSFSEITKLKESEWVSGAYKFYVYGIYTTKKIYSISDSNPGFNVFMQIIKDKGIYIETIAEQIKAKKERKNKTKQ